MEGRCGACQVCGAKRSVTAISGEALCLLAWLQEAPGALKCSLRALPKRGHSCHCIVGSEGLLEGCDLRGKQHFLNWIKRR